MAQPNRSTFFVSVAAAAAAGLVVLTAPVPFPLSPLVRARPKLHRLDGVPKKLIF